MENTTRPAGDAPVSLFVSDTHLFHKRNSALDIHGHVIEQTHADTLYLLGDIMDYEYLWDMMKNSLKKDGLTVEDVPAKFEEAIERLDLPELENHLRFWDVIMARKAEGMKVHYVTGNHDNNLDIYHGQEKDGIAFHDHMIEEFGGEITHLEHGDDNDPGCLRNYDGLYATCSKALDALLFSEHKLKNLFDRVTPPEARYPFPVVNSAKSLAKFFISDFRETAASRGIERGASATVAGHIHKQDIATLSHVFDIGGEDQLKGSPMENMAPFRPTLVDTAYTYRNTGDGLTHGTGLLYDPNESHTALGGWRALDERDVTYTKTFDLTEENPYKAYRPETMAFLQKGWDALLQMPNLTKGWDHAASHTDLPVNDGKPAGYIPSSEALYPNNGM